VDRLSPFFTEDVHRKMSRQIKRRGGFFSMNIQEVKDMKELLIGNLRAKLPVIQGGMGIGISLSGLASAVADQGGVGVISTAGVGMFEPDFSTNFLEANIRALKNEIRKAREKTKGILEVNVMVLVQIIFV